MSRAFTMLELLLAMAMASLVAVGAFGVIGMMNRGDATLETRSTHVRELATVHGLIQEALGSLVMSDAERPDNTNIGGESLDQDLEEIMAFDGVDDDQPIRPRMLLRPDPSGLATTPQAQHAPQAFELVLDDGIASFNEPEELSLEQLGQLQRGREAIRGVLELRPEDSAWALWWRPVTEDGAAIRPDYESNREISALRLCGGLTSCLWKVFYRGDRITAYQATWSNDLPAYIELELSTTTGIYANWVFEIGWSSSAESQQFDELGNEPGGGAAGAGGAAGEGAAGAPPEGGGAAGGRRSDRRSGGSATSGGS